MGRMERSISKWKLVWKIFGEISLVKMELRRVASFEIDTLSVKMFFFFLILFHNCQGITTVAQRHR